MDALNAIMTLWNEMSKNVGDKGYHVKGAGFSFIYKGIPTFMPAQSPWQGSYSWEESKDLIEEMLVNIGATEICYNWGDLD